MNLKVDEYLSQAKQWRKELETLRAIILECQLIEEFKWRHPCYTYQKSNIVIIGELKDSCTLSFFKGVLLKDPKGILIQPGKNTRVARMIPFTSVQEIVEQESILKAYLSEAVELEKAGLKIDFSQDRELAIPAELQKRLEENSELSTAFDSLTPGRRRAYLLFFSWSQTIQNTRVKN